jgi:regulator of RNase E activity RraA
MTTSQEAGVWPAGYRINPRAAHPDAQLIEEFRSIPVPVAGDCLGRSVGAVGLRPYHGDRKAVLCGPAFTVRVRPGDNLMIHKAMLMAQPGDVLVIDGGGDLTQALIGGLMRTTAVARKLGGFVIDGAIRDVVEWEEDGMPIFAKGNTHRGPSKDGPGEINVPIACAGMAVNPGDLVLGDTDGVISIPPEALPALLRAARIHLEKEAVIRAQNAAGKSDVERIDSILRKKGLPL